MSHHRRNFSNERMSSPLNGGSGSTMFGGYSQAAVVQAGLCLGQLINAVYNVLSEIISKDGAHPIVFSFYRDICAAPILFAAAWYVDGAVRWPRQEDAPRIVAQGAFSVAASINRPPCCGGVIASVRGWGDDGVWVIEKTVFSKSS